MKKQEVDILLVTALPEEHSIMLKMIKEFSPLSIESSGPVLLHLASINSFQNDITYTISCATIGGMGPEDAGAAINAIRNTIDPKFIILVGIAMGMVHNEDIELGDVIISDQIISTTNRKIKPDEEPEYRFKALDVSKPLVQRMQSFIAEEDLMEYWRSLIRYKRPNLPSLPHRKKKQFPDIFIGKYASGGEVVKATEASVVKALLKQFPYHLYALEMEGGGILSNLGFSWQNMKPEFIAIKGLSDWGLDNTVDDEWRKYSIYTSVACAITLIRSGYLPRHESVTSEIMKDYSVIEKRQYEAHSNIRPITIHETIVEYSDAIGGLVGTIPLVVCERNTSPSINPINDIGWYEIVAGPAAGKTTLAFLMADKAIRANRQTYYFDFRLFQDSLKLPDDFPKHALLLLDNAHLSKEASIHQLFHQLPKEVLIVAFSRDGARLVSRHLSEECTTSSLNDSEIKKYLSDAIMDEEKLTPEQQILLDKCITEVSDWEQARWLRSSLKRDIEKTIDDYSNKVSIDEYFSFLIRRRLEQDGLLDNEVLVDIASFTFIDLQIFPAERDRTNDNFEGEFATVQRHGWLSHDGTQLSHPRLAEQILRTRGLLTNKEEGGERLGRRLAKLLIRGNATEARLLQVIRNIRYGNLTQVPKLLLKGLYPELRQAPQQTIPLNSVLTHFGSDLRREGEITGALEQFHLVSQNGRKALWRYEYAFIPFMKGTEKSLKKAEKILLPDLNNIIIKDRLINSGLYALVLSRQGLLEEADGILRNLINLKSMVKENLDAKRWVGNAAIHYCETGIGLVAHGKLTIAELDNRIAMAEKLSDHPAFKSGSAYIESLYAVLKGDWNSCWKAIEIVIEENRLRQYVQQRGVYLAIKALAAYFLGKPNIELTLLKEIIALTPEFDNRKAQLWAHNRIKEIGTRPDPLILVKQLYPDVNSGNGNVTQE